MINNILRGLKIEEIESLAEWRQWASYVLFVVALVVLPLSVLIALPTFLEENRYGLITLDLVVILIVFARFFDKKTSYRVWMGIGLALIYIMTIFFFVTLGPHYARSAWLLFFSVITALFLGTRAGAAAVFINVVMLLSLYALLSPENKSWVTVYEQGFAKYLVFIVNTAFIALLPTLIAGFMLKKLGQAHDAQQLILMDLRKKNKYLEKAKEELTRREEQLNVILKAIPDPCVVYDMDWRPVYLNTAFNDLFGFSLEELQEKQVSYIPEGQKRASSVKLKELYKDSGNVQFETARLTKKNEKLDVLLGASIIKDLQGKKHGYVVNLTNITQQKKDEARRRQSQKMESIGTFAGGIAHDFNNILFPIIGNTEILMTNILKEGEYRKCLDGIYSGALRARDLVRQILIFSRKENIGLKPMRIQPVIEEVLNLIRASIPPTIEIEHHINENCEMILADSTQLHQIVMNLATNAFHAMEETGGILKVVLKDIELRNHDSDVLELKPGFYASLVVSDTGVGMDKDLVKKVFDPFFTTKMKGKGTGLGLSVVHGIITSMGGSIKFDSEPGKGTSCSVYFPLVNGTDS